MKKGCIVFAVIAVIIGGIFGLWLMGSYNSLVDQDTKVDKSWSDVESAYQRRFDLIDNLVATVEGAADFEKGTLTDVIEARSNANSIKLSVDELTPENIQKFEQAQSELNQSFLGRLNFLNENYPQLQSVVNFRDLQSQLEGTENRIKIERDKFNEQVRIYEAKRRSFPTNIVAGMMGFDKIGSFSSDAGASKAPKVEFNKK